MKELFNLQRFKLYGWIGLVVLGLSLLGDAIRHPSVFYQYAPNDLWRILYIVAVNYFFFEYTLPRLSWQRWFRSLMLILFHIFLFSAGAYIWRSIGAGLHIVTLFKTTPDTENQVGELFGQGLASLIFFAVIRHVYLYIKLKKAARQLRIEKQEAELNFLKSQTNPHFLFNTLNNIYSLSRDKSDLAPESIMRLSKIMRFMLYEAGGAYIAIDQELKIIGDYIELEKLRYDDSLRINFNYDIEDKNQSLPPLLLIPLVENAFKHGVSETRTQPFIDIHVSVNRRQLVCTVKNSADANPEADVKENIGLSNLRRQLQLLYTDYELSVQQNGPVFTAILKINLSSHVNNNLYHHRR